MNITVVAPSAPTNLMGSVEARSVLLTWSQSSLDVVETYTISYARVTGCISAQPYSELVSISGSRRSYYLLSFLEENSLYEINITSVNTVGSSLASTYQGFTIATRESEISQVKI